MMVVTSGERHTNIWVWLCLTCNQSGFQDQPCSKHPDGPLCNHHNFSKCWAGNMETWVSENPDSSDYLGMRRTELHKRLLGVLRGSDWVYFNWLSQLQAHLWLIHVSKCWLSQQALRILNRHQHLFCVTIRYRGCWLRGQLGCKASHQVFKQNRSFSRMSFTRCHSRAEVTDHTLWIFTLIAFWWQGPQRPGNGHTKEQGQKNTKLQKTMIHRTTDSTTVPNWEQKYLLSKQRPGKDVFEG